MQVPPEVKIGGFEIKVDADDGTHAGPVFSKGESGIFHGIG